MLKLDMPLVILGYSKFFLLNGFEIFMVVYVKHEIATVIFVDFYE